MNEVLFRMDFIDWYRKMVKNELPEDEEDVEEISCPFCKKGVNVDDGQKTRSAIVLHLDTCSHIEKRWKEIRETQEATTEKSNFFYLSRMVTTVVFGFIAYVFLNRSTAYDHSE